MEKKRTSSSMARVGVSSQHDMPTTVASSAAADAPISPTSLSSSIASADSWLRPHLVAASMHNSGGSGVAGFAISGGILSKMNNNVSQSSLCHHLHESTWSDRQLSLSLSSSDNPMKSLSSLQPTFYDGSSTSISVSSRAGSTHTSLTTRSGISIVGPESLSTAAASTPETHTSSSSLLSTSASASPSFLTVRNPNHVPSYFGQARSQPNLSTTRLLPRRDAERRRKLATITSRSYWINSGDTQGVDIDMAGNHHKIITTMPSADAFKHSGNNGACQEIIRNSNGNFDAELT